MKMKYTVTIRETLARQVQVEASTPAEAEQVAGQLYRESRIVLDADDYVDTTITVAPQQPLCSGERKVPIGIQ